MDPLPPSRSKPPATRKPLLTRGGRRRPSAHAAEARVGYDADARRRFAEELERAKLDAMKELAYGASHEINNPLANIALRAQTLLKRETDADKRKALEAMHRAAMRAHEMISDLMLFARPPAPEKRSVRLTEVLDRVVEEMAPPAAEHGVEVSRAPGGEEAIAWADPLQVAVAVKALVDNAAEAIGRGGAGATGRVELSATRLSGETVEVVVRDDGPGIPESIRPHVFDPFFSGREAGRGLGFGLSKCWRIVTGHGGQVRIDSARPSGVVITARLPAAIVPREC